MPVASKLTSPLRDTLLALLGAASAAGPGGAAASVATGAAADLETVTVYARRQVPLTRVVAAVTVIDQDAMERALVSDAKELVRYEPGLSVRRDPFRFGLDTFAIRGVGGGAARAGILPVWKRRHRRGRCDDASVARIRAGG
jgi:hemoglobin/transferrin/lactoferrin receptor protein